MTMQILLRVVLVAAVMAGSLPNLGWGPGHETPCDDAEVCADLDPCVEADACNEIVARGSHAVFVSAPAECACEFGEATACSHKEVSECPPGPHEHQQSHHHHQCICSGAAVGLFVNADEWIQPLCGGETWRESLWSAPLEPLVFLLDRPPIA